MKVKMKPRKAHLMVDGKERELAFWSPLSEKKELEAAAMAYLLTLFDIDVKPKNIQVVDVSTISYKEFFSLEKEQNKNLESKKKIQEKAIQMLES